MQIANLRKRITKKYFDRDPDSICQGKGLPPYRWDYTGGTFAEDRTVALSDGCQTPHVEHGYDVSGDQTDFCCPQAPRGW